MKNDSLASLAKRGNKNPMWGKHHTRKFRHSEESKRKISEANKGRQLSEETKRKMSKAQMGNKKGLGKHPSEETRQKLRNASKGNKHFLGRLHSEETKKKMRGGNHYNWRGGTSFEPYTQDWTDDLRESIRKRDDFVCQLCGIHQDELGGYHKKLDCHHIDYNKDNLSPDNLITLCKKCHSKTNHKRERWIKILKK